MRYDHMVKRNGTYYTAGTDIPEEEITLPFSDDQITFETESNSTKKYTKSEIMQMKTVELQELALNSGIDDARNRTGTDLKRTLIEKFRIIGGENLGRVKEVCNRKGDRILERDSRHRAENRKDADFHC